MKTKLLLLLLLANFSIYAQTNLVSNGDFETWTSSSQPTDWFRYFNGLVYQDSNAQNGLSSTKMEITSGTFNYMNSSPFAIQSGKTYHVTMYHKLVSGTITSVELSLTKADVFKTTITKKTETSTVNSQWKKIEFDYVSTTSQNAEISIWINGSTGAQIVVDNVSIIDAAETGPKYTLIPDLNFEKALIEAGIDSGTADGKVLTSQISSVTSLSIDSKNIADLSGIQDFKDLEILNCSKNALSTLDVTKNIYLSTLNFSGNSLTGINTSQNTELKYLIGSDNKLATLSLTNNKKLKQLQVSNNLFSSLAVSSNTLLEDLNVDKNSLTILNLNSNTALKTVSFTQNQIAAISFAQNTLLTDLTCWGNKLTALDVSKNTALVSLYCDSNKITTLNLSANPNLVYLTCASNSLTELNLKNGANTKISKNALDLRNNPNLTCIQVDNISHSNTNWSMSKDASATFNVDCTVYTLIPDVNFENKLIALKYDTAPADGRIATSKISGLTSLNVENSSISDLTGLQDFKNLKVLDCRQNNLTTLDVSQNLLLESITCTFNKITALNVTKNSKLVNLYCSNNKLTTVNTSNNPALKSLVCFVNEITALDVTSNPELTSLSCSTNNIKVLNLSNNPKLGMLSMRLNEVSKLDLSKCPALYSVDCFANLLTELNLKNGSNNLITNSNINLAANNELTCISVDNVSDANTNWGNKKDATASFSNNCTLGIEDSVFDKVVLFPNPTKGEVQINNISLEKATVYNSLGQLVKTFVFDSGDTNHTVNLSGLPKGIYYIYLINDDAASAKKVIVE